MQKYAFRLNLLALLLLFAAMPVLIRGAGGDMGMAFFGMALFGLSLAISLMLRDKKK